MENEIKSQSDLVRACGFKPSLMNMVLSGKANLGIKKAKCVCKHLGLNDPTLWMDPVRANERKQAFYDAIGRV